MAYLRKPTETSENYFFANKLEFDSEVLPISQEYRALILSGWGVKTTGVSTAMALSENISRLNIITDEDMKIDYY
jgi:hypothetical protein